MRAFVLLTLQKYGEHSLSELESDTANIHAREPFEGETLEQCLTALSASGMIRKEMRGRDEWWLPVRSREKKAEIAAKQELMF